MKPAYLKPLSIIVSAITLLVLAIASQSQTLSSLVQPSLVASTMQDSQLQTELDKLVQRMEQRIASDDTDYEARLLKSMSYFQQGERERAIDEVAALSQQAPQFHLAHLVYADMLSARFATLTDIGEPGLMLKNAKQEQLQALRQEALMRWQANLKPVATTQLPLQLLSLNAKTKTALVVDKTRHRLYVYAGQGAGQPPKLLKDFYISTGKKPGNKVNEGDLRTPEGI